MSDYPEKYRKTIPGRDLDYLSGKKIISLFLSSILLSVCFHGCVIKETLYLQDIEVSGALSNPPVHITSNDSAGSFTISPKLSISTAEAVSGKVDGHSHVDENGVFRVDTIRESGERWKYRESDRNIRTFEGKNVYWNIPDFTIGFDLDWKMTGSIALFGGLSFSSIKNKNLFSYNFGIGASSQKGNWGFRTDIGFNINSMWYKANTVAAVEINSIFSHSDEVIFFEDTGTSTSFDPFIIITVNSTDRSALLNYFISAGYLTHTLFDFEPVNVDPMFYPFVFHETVDMRGQASAGFIYFCPGIYYDIDDDMRLVAGIKIMKELQIEEASKSLFISPMVRMDIRF